MLNEEMMKIANSMNINNNVKNFIESLNEIMKNKNSEEQLEILYSVNDFMFLEKIKLLELYN